MEDSQWEMTGRGKERWKSDSNKADEGGWEEEWMWMVWSAGERLRGGSREERMKDIKEWMRNVEESSWCGETKHTAQERWHKNTTESEDRKGIAGSLKSWKDHRENRRWRWKLEGKCWQGRRTRKRGSSMKMERGQGKKMDEYVEKLRK